MPDEYTIDGETYQADEIELVPQLDGTFIIRLIADPETIVGTTCHALAGVSVVEESLNGPPMLSYDHVAGKMVRVHGNSHGGVYTNRQMPSKGIGRSKREHVELVTASKDLFTPAADFHLVDLNITGINTSVSNNTRWQLREGPTGPVRFLFQHGTGAVGAPEHFSSVHTWDEHPVFAAGVPVRLELLSGTLTMAVNLQGYEASH